MCNLDKLFAGAKGYSGGHYWGGGGGGGGWPLPETLSIEFRIKYALSNS